MNISLIMGVCVCVCVFTFSLRYGWYRINSRFTQVKKYTCFRIITHWTEWTLRDAEVILQVFLQNHFANSYHTYLLYN